MVNEAVTAQQNPEPEKDRINPIVFYGSAIGIVAFAVWAMFFTAQAGTVINAILAWISDTFGWFYFVAVVAYLLFVICIALSRYGNLKLGSARPTPRLTSTWSLGPPCCFPLASVLTFYSSVSPSRSPSSWPRQWVKPALSRPPAMPWN